MSLKTPLARVKGLGSARKGVSHFWMQRVTAAALIPLMGWLLASIVAYSAADYDAAILYLKDPINVTLLLLLIVAAFAHMRLGLQVVIEDYIHREGTKIALLVLVNFASIGLAALGIVSLLSIAFSR
ncbi:MAG: succinate dehydrogenase, hydrophobic membrane anchor protein [Alphaproteobacteria bacterium]